MVTVNADLVGEGGGVDGQKSKFIRENVHKRNYRATVNYCDGYNLDT